MISIQKGKNIRSGEKLKIPGESSEDDSQGLK
jgi:hypothetical protein